MTIYIKLIFKDIERKKVYRKKVLSKSSEKRMKSEMEKNTITETTTETTQDINTGFTKNQTIDFTGQDEKQIQNSIKDKDVGTILKECEIGKSLPIIFDKIAKKYNIDIYGTDFNYVSEIDSIKQRIIDKGKILGMVSIKNGRANIYYNNNEDIDIAQQRFVIAHEIAHCVYDYDDLVNEGIVEFSNENSCDEREQLCDSFAMELLIPNKLVKFFYDNIKKPKIDDLANIFLVPKDKMEKRLNYLGYKIYN